MLDFLRKKLDTESKTLFRNSSWVFIANFFGAAIAFLKSIIIARGLGAELFGIFTVIIVFIGTVQETMNLNLGAALIRFGSKFKSDHEPEKVVALIRLSFIASSIVTVVSILVIAGFTVFSYNTFIGAPGLGWFAILWSIAASSIFFNQISRSALRLYFKFRINSMVQMIMDLIEFAITGAALWMFPRNLEVFLVAVLMAKFINSLVPNIAAYRELLPGFREHLHVSAGIIRSYYKEIRGFVLKNSIARTLQVLIKNGDVLLISFFTADPLQVAYYSVGKKVAFSIMTVTDPLVTSIYPQLCDLYYQGKIGKIRSMILRLTLLAAIPSAVFLVIAVLFNKWIMITVFGADYIAAGKTFYILTGASLVSATLFWIQPLLQAIDLLAIRLYIYLAGIAAGLASAWFLVPQYGSNGMAYSMIIMNVVMPLLFVYFAMGKLRRESQTGI